MYYNNAYMQPSYYPQMNNGAMPDNLAMLRGANQYQPNFPTYQGMQTNAQQAQGAANNSGMIWVDTEQEALSYPIAPNNAVALWDNYNPVVYLKKSDASGKTTTEIYDLVKRQPMNAQQPMQAESIQTVDYITRKEFNELEAKLNGFINAKAETPTNITTDIVEK